MTSTRFILALVAAGLLAACATTRVPRAPLPPGLRADALARQAVREQALAAQPDWQLEGRVALSNGTRGGSGRLEWRQDGDRYAVALSAPITRQSWRVVGDAAGATLEGLEGGPRTGSDPGQLLREATGWDIPVTALSAWVRGAGADAAGPVRLQFSADGRLARLQQAGWTLDYDRWHADPALGIELPGRVNAQRDQARVRLVIDDWANGDAAP